MDENGPSPIVVGGCYRSGTSLVRRILDAHPHIYCGPEVKFLQDFHDGYIEDPIRHVRFMTTARTMLPEGQLLEILGAAFVEMHERAARAAGKARWADKAPENLLFLDDWERLLGDRWTLLHVVRNPLDTLASIEESGFPVSIPKELDARIGLYLDCMRAGLDFAAANPDRYVRLCYEELVSRPEATVRALMDSLGERFDPIQLAIGSYPHQRGLEDPKVGRATAVHRDSLGRWRADLDEGAVGRIVAKTADVWSRVDPRGAWPLPSA